MDRCALFVDAGYVLADGAMAVHGTRHREAVAWDFPGLLQLLTGLSRERTGLPLLRCYWYEATIEGRRTPEHDVLADIPGLKLRLARIRPGRREGVDAQVHRDLMTLARNNAVCDAVVVSGDEDLAQVVSDAQDLGIRVTVMQIAAADGGWSASRTLRQECDDLIEVGGNNLRPYVTLTTAQDSGVTLGNGQHHQQSSGNGQSHGNGVVPLANGSHGGGRSSSGHRRHSPPALPAQPSTPPSYSSYGQEAQTTQSQPGTTPLSPQPGLSPSSPSQSAQSAQSQSAQSQPGQPQAGQGQSPPSQSSPSSPAPPQAQQPSSHSAPSPLSSPLSPPSSPGLPSSSPPPPSVPSTPSGPVQPQSHAAPTSPSGPSSPTVQTPASQPSGPGLYTTSGGGYAPSQLGPYTGPQPAPVPVQNTGTTTLAEAVKAAHKEGHDFGDSVARDAPALWLEAVLARKPRMPSDLEARLLQGSSLPIDFLLHDEVRHALRRGFWDALERARR
ncbi:NYN domain-containing protein [Microbispora sp. RL4-1S]|uniref:NYN domain-containing protein n=1 Tax=Microbispora oryzae TaxID=2806554 RepID=A0A940WW27_9ACTN|nr:NYN domain-containing protein [Microbispora oryzae]MBP2708465.1 NYN domain-containing protein [Microbispora oryzae]